MSLRDAYLKSKKGKEEGMRGEVGKGNHQESRRDIRSALESAKNILAISWDFTLDGNRGVKYN